MQAGTVLVQHVTLTNSHRSITGSIQSPCCDRGVCRCLVILETQWCRLCGPCSLEEPSALESCRRWYHRLLAQAMRGVFLCRRLPHAWLCMPPYLTTHISDTRPLRWGEIATCQVWETQLDDILHCRWEARSFILDHTGFRESVGGHPDAADAPHDSRSAFAISLWNQHHLRVSLPPFLTIRSLSCIDMVCRVALEDVADVKPCMDPSLPAGHAFWVSLHTLPTGLYFVAGMPYH